ncbi:hypothetical protein [Tepidamorphus gemmatus]|uniref:hypothetical protein n=1 Tax=Tepidamorphus gemmatus TaxID=747076 RepID=UPI0014054EE0|nr:hypothetical protein [Tepidamorphus gemmatus]
MKASFIAQKERLACFLNKRLILLNYLLGVEPKRLSHNSALCELFGGLRKSPRNCARHFAHINIAYNLILDATTAQRRVCTHALLVVHATGSGVGNVGNDGHLSHSDAKRHS